MIALDFAIATAADFAITLLGFTALIVLLVVAPMLKGKR